MHEIFNRTPFVAAMAPVVDKLGRDHVALVVKGTFRWSENGTLQVEEDEEARVPVHYADELHGEPGKSSIKYASDACVRKVGTDIALVGHARSPNRTTSMKVGLRVGPVKKELRVFGDRHYESTVTGWKISDPTPFTEMPLVFERAYGGFDRSKKDPKDHECEARNPVGAGFSAQGNKLEGVALPNLEDPTALIGGWKDRPTPASFGFVSGGWRPRVGLAGTYDQAWEKNRKPLLPDDFDERYYNAAAEDLVAAPHLVGGEQVVVLGCTAGGKLGFHLPKHVLSVETRLKDREQHDTPLLDTIVIEPDEQRLTLTWRATIACPGELLHIRSFVVREVR